MKKLTFILLLSVFTGITFSGYSQDCPSASLIFYDQSEIDAFAVNYPNCTQIDGIIRIGGPPTGVITNLNGLSALQHVGAHVYIENNKHLKSLEGLNNLETIGLHLIIKGCDSLESLQGLNSLTSVGALYNGDMVIEANKTLTELSGLENLSSLAKDLIITKNVDLLTLHGLEGLTTLSGKVIITENKALQTLEGLESLTYVSGDMVIKDNLKLVSTKGLDMLSHIGGDLILRNQPLMMSLSGETARNDSPALDNLQVVDGEIRISNNALLQNLNGLQNLNQTGSFIRISSNPNLQQLNGFQNLNAVEALRIEHNKDLHTLQGFESLETIRDYLLITGNHSLTSLDGFEGLLPETLQSLYVANNHSLSDCAVESLCDYLIDQVGEAYFANNSGGCSSIEDVMDACFTALPGEISVKALMLFPNPASEKIYIQGLPEGMKLHKVQISNHTGQLVREVDHPAYEIDIQNLSPGMYFFSLEVGERLVQKKVVIK